MSELIVGKRYVIQMGYADGKIVTGGRGRYLGIKPFGNSEYHAVLTDEGAMLPVPGNMQLVGEEEADSIIEAGGMFDCGTSFRSAWMQVSDKERSKQCRDLASCLCKMAISVVEDVYDVHNSGKEGVSNALNALAHVCVGLGTFVITMGTPEDIDPDEVMASVIESYRQVCSKYGIGTMFVKKDGDIEMNGFSDEQ